TTVAGCLTVALPATSATQAKPIRPSATGSGGFIGASASVMSENLRPTSGTFDGGFLPDTAVAKIDRLNSTIQPATNPAAPVRAQSSTSLSTVNHSHITLPPAPPI